MGRRCSGERWGAWVSRYRLRGKRQMEEERRNGINSGAKHEIIYYVGPFGAESMSLTLAYAGLTSLESKGTVRKSAKKGALELKRIRVRILGGFLAT